VRGPEVARRLCATRRDMKVIFMSGYTEGEFGSGDKPGPELPILQKPFELDALAVKLREVLEARTRR
jgi:FixJ family two-component response regulator